MESSAKAAERVMSPRYRLVAMLGVLLVAGLACFMRESARDWDFYYRLSAATYNSGEFDMRGEDVLLLTRCVFMHDWVFYLPVLGLAVVLIVIRRKTASAVVRHSFVAVFVMLVLAYLAVYLPVAKPEWWWGGRPEGLIKAAKGHAAIYEQALKREEELRNKPRHEE